MQKLLLAALCALSVAFVQAQTKNFIDQPHIEVNGNADTLVTPDQIFIRILISERDTRDKVSVEEQELKMVNALKELKIDTEKELSTKDILSNYKYYLLKSKDIVKSKLYILKVTDAMTASKVFMRLEDLGISNTSIERVDHSALESIRNMMRVKAVENAMARAVALTKPLNQFVGPAIHIADNDVQPFNNNLQGRVAGVVVRGTSSISPKEELPKMEFEQIKVSGTVSVKFILRHSIN